MFAPDISKLPPVGTVQKYLEVDVNKFYIENALNSHHFNHSVIAIFPDTLHIPNDLKSILTEDSNYYKVAKLPIYHLLEENFIEAFVKRGKMTALSIDNLLDIDNCACVTPTGFFILSLQEDVYLSLGIEKNKPTVDIHKLGNSRHRYLIVINLKMESFIPGKKIYEHILKRLKDCKIILDFLIQWEPTVSKICPSSVAAYFHKMNYNVEECSIILKERREYDVKIPTVENSSAEIFEWLGLFSQGFIELNEDSTLEFLSSYSIPDDNQKVGQVSLFQWNGFMISSKIVKFFSSLREYVQTRSDIPWVCFHVQGFEDTPVTWDLQHHNYAFSGENHFSAMIYPSGPAKTCKTYTIPKKKIY